MCTDSRSVLHIKLIMGKYNDGIVQMLLCWIGVCEQFSEIEFLKDSPNTVDCF